MSDSDGKQSSAATTTTTTSSSSNDVKLGSSDNGENVKVENGTFFFLEFFARISVIFGKERFCCRWVVFEVLSHDQVRC